ncbi:FUSC family protein [Clostridium sp. DL1XJH146]
MKVFKIFKLKKEAVLLDSKYFIIKSFLAVLFAYLISKNNPILSLDMISVLFGLMLTLEPVSLTGIRRGFEQVYATILGAFSTAIIIFIGGNNFITVALAIAFTLYVCLKINWREVSPVAIFTSIYMTQLVQTNLAGEPSIFLTMRLRLVALGAGVLVAIVFNFLFSFFTYREMIYKRVIYIISKIEYNLRISIKAIEEKNTMKSSEIMYTLPATFNDIDWTIAFFSDLTKEYKFINKLMPMSQKEIFDLNEIILNLRTITHMNYDVLYMFSNYKAVIEMEESTILNCTKMIGQQVEIINSLQNKIIDRSNKKEDNNKTYTVSDFMYEKNKMNWDRITNDIEEIEYSVLNILKIIEK